MKKTILLISFIGCCFAAFSQATTYYVDVNSTGSGSGTMSDPFKTIQEAIDKPGNGNIIKVAKGTYSEAITISEKKLQLLGGFAGNGDFTTVDTVANKTIISGTKTKPCIYVLISKNVDGSMTISGFTIRNGLRGMELSGDGGGFLNNLTIENNIFENNVTQVDTQFGGAISLEGKNVTIQKNIFRNNKAGRGPAISASGTDLLIADNRIENNTAFGDHAGGVQVYGTGTVTRNIFDGNRVAHPDNYGWGGAIMVIADPTHATTVTLSHNIYRNNHAPSCGGAVFVDDGATARMEHELLYNNTSKSHGSAIYVDSDGGSKSSTLNMFNCTISGNSTPSNDAAMYVQGSITNVENCIFWNNGKDFEFLADGKPLAKLTVNYTLTQQGYTGTGNIKSDPLFADATNSDVAKRDFHLKSKYGRYNPSTGLFVNDDVHSPAIDAGNPTSSFANEPSPNGGRINMGRYGNTAEASKSATTGMEEISQTSLKVFPNPTTGELRVESGELRVESVEIFDVMGRKQSFSTLNSQFSTPIDISHLPAGIYFLKVDNVTVKVIKL